MMTNRPTLYFSNQLEQLAEALGAELFKGGTDPLERKVVLLPHHSLKSYLTTFFSRHPRWRISIGVEYKTLLLGVQTLLGEEEGRLPSKIGLFLRIERELSLLAQEGRWDALSGYLKESEEKKRAFLAEELSSLFYGYATLEGAALEGWLQKEGWKQELWKKVFCPPLRPLTEAMNELKRGGKTVHLFGFAHLPFPFLSFLCQFKANFYVLSPSEMFWEDLCSDKERLFLEKKMTKSGVHLKVQEQMRFFLTKTHPLLANWAALGRPLLGFLGERESYLYEMYKPNEEDNLLSYIQNGLLTLEESGEEKKKISPRDTSLLCLSAPSRLREVEALFATLQELMKSSPSTRPQDVLVLASDLPLYFPFIQMVFGQQNSPFAFSLHGLSPLSISEEARAIESLFSLASSQFDRKVLWHLFSFSSFRTQCCFTKEEIERLQGWVERTTITWGLSAQQKETCLRKRAVEDKESTKGSWLEGLSSLLLALAEEFEEDFPISWNEAELVGRFMQTLSSLDRDLRPVYEGKRYSWEEWITFSLSLLCTYLAPSREREDFCSYLRGLLGELSDVPPFSLSFESFKRVIDHYFSGHKESLQSGSLHAIKFLPFEMGSSFPAKILCVLGCDEESIPGKEVLSPLSEQGEKRETPSLAQQSRYLFLELLLHARETLLFSYVRVCPRDQKEQGPSRLLKELLDYVDDHYFVEGEKEKPSDHLVRHHPALSFSKVYFQKGSPFTHHVAFPLAESYYSRERREPPSFFPAWQGKKEENKPLQETLVIDVHKLESFAKQPLRFYLREKVGLFFESRSPEDREFFLSPFDKAVLRRQGGKKGLGQIIRLTKQREELASCWTHKMGLADLEEDVRRYREHLSCFSLAEEDWVTFEFSPDVRRIEQENNRVLMPAVSLDLEEGTVTLQGQIHPVSREGFLSFAKKKEEYPRFWPLYLLFIVGARALGWREDVLLLEEGRRLSFSPFDPVVLLKRYVTVYLKALREPCPLPSSLLSTLCLKEEENLDKKRQSLRYEGRGYQDPSEKWIEKRETPPSSSYVCAEWKKVWQEALSPLFYEEEGYDDV